MVVFSVHIYYNSNALYIFLMYKKTNIKEMKYGNKKGTFKHKPMVCLKGKWNGDDMTLIN